jgi:thiamine biosynthesis lipoprotein
MNRREFVRFLAGMAGIGVASSNLLARELFFRNNLATPAVVSTRQMMGTSVSISVLDSDRFTGVAATDIAFSEMERLERMMNRYRDDSPLSTLNRESQLHTAPNELLKVLERANFFSVLSQGAFDVTVEPIVDLMAHSFAWSDSPPSASEVVNLLQEVGYDKIELTGSTIRLRKGMGITLDGIAKGYIIDSAIETLRTYGCLHALIEAGGDIRTLGDKDQGKGWRIGIRDPFGRQDLIRTLYVSDQAVATSGDYEVFFDTDKKYFHIVNPKNGCCPQEVQSATVIASNAMDADALGTTIMVLGSERGLDLVEETDGVECFLVLRDGSTVESSGMESYW